MNRVVLGLFAALFIGQCVQAEESSDLKKSHEYKCMREADSNVPLEQSLKNLENKLNLTEQQKALWITWSTQLLAAHHIKDEFNRTSTERRKLPAPERQEKWMTSVETHLKAMRDSLPALKAFYGSLNDQQKIAFDSEVPFKHHGSGMMCDRPSQDR
jgi:LTXXQ motif family protein